MGPASSANCLALRVFTFSIRLTAAEFMSLLNSWSRNTVRPSLSVSWNQSLHVTRFPVQLWKYSCPIYIGRQHKHALDDDSRSNDSKYHARSAAVPFTYHSFNTFKVSVGSRLLVGQYVGCIEHIESLVFHGSHVETVHCNRNK